MRFTAEQDAILHKHYATNGPQFCADMIGKSRKQVCNRAFALGLRHASKRRRTYVGGKAEPATLYSHAALSAALRMATSAPNILNARMHRMNGERE